MTIVSSYVSLPEGIYTSYPQKSPRLTVARHRGDGTSEAVAGDDHVLTSWHHVVFKKRLQQRGLYHLTVAKYHH